MKIAGIQMPTTGAIVREAVVVVAGAVIAAWAIGQFPALRAWIDRQWTGKECDCGR